VRRESGVVPPKVEIVTGSVERKGKHNDVVPFVGQLRTGHTYHVTVERLN
jgi:hypothetical protein